MLPRTHVRASLARLVRRVDDAAFEKRRLYMGYLSLQNGWPLMGLYGIGPVHRLWRWLRKFRSNSGRVR